MKKQILLIILGAQFLSLEATYISKDIEKNHTTIRDRAINVQEETKTASSLESPFVKDDEGYHKDSVLRNVGVYFSSQGEDQFLLKNLDPYKNEKQIIIPMNEVELVEKQTSNKFPIKEGDIRYQTTFEHYDGFGRLAYTEAKGITPKGEDLITYQEYDTFDRLSKIWLPVSCVNFTGRFLEIKDRYAKVYEDESVFHSNQIYDESPLARLVKSYGPGLDWINKNKAQSISYLTNIKNVSLPEYSDYTDFETLGCNMNKEVMLDTRVSAEFLYHLILEEKTLLIIDYSTVEPTEGRLMDIVKHRSLQNIRTGEYYEADSIEEFGTEGGGVGRYTCSIFVDPGEYIFTVDCSDMALVWVAVTSNCGEAREDQIRHSLVDQNDDEHINDNLLKCSSYYYYNGKLERRVRYETGEFFVSKKTNEGGNITLEFKNKLGQVVLLRQVETKSNDLYDTYYIYDDFGNISYVLPPRIHDEGISQDKLNELAYQYKYDEYSRCTWKKLPGVEPISYVYDKADRLIFSQDGEQRNKGEWTFSIPDVFGRTVITGTCKTANKANIIAGRFDNWIIKAEYTGATTYEGYELKVGNSSFNAFSLEGVSIHSVNYYDNYNFKQLANINTKSLNFVSKGAEYDKRYGTDTSPVEAKGLLTGSIVAQFDNTATVNHLYSTMYYDNRGRLIQTQSTNHLGGKESEYIAYNFVGQPIKKLHEHTVNNKLTTEVYSYHYDHAGRLIDTHHQLDNAEPILIAHNTYDELGRLKTNKKGNDTNDNLKTTYDYNIRSWTSKISSPLFTQNLYYNTVPSGSSVTPQYGGNVSAMSWKVENEAERKYGFTYDGLSRLTHSAYDYKASGGNFSTSYSYDKHGNMMTHVQRGVKSKGVYEMVDNLVMSYNGNQLINVHNGGTGSLESTSAHFEDYSKDPGKTKVEYTYNANGALASDLNKGSVIKYNSLNLPTKLEISNTKVRGEINYTYSASGAKLRTVHKEDISMTKMPVVGTGAYTTPEWDITTTDYVGNKVYEQVNNGERVLKRILIDGGYYDAVKKKYFYYLTDHLGNNRVVAEANRTVVQKTHYYPFGMAFAEETAKDEGQKEQPYKYNGKELDRRLQLNTYDYEARYMDPAIGRFTSIDPHAEKYYSWSPYAYAMNNPLKYIDPTGMDTVTHVTHGIVDDYSSSTGYTTQVVTATEGGERSIVVDNPLPEIAVEGKYKRRQIDMISLSYSTTMAIGPIGYEAKASLVWIPKDGVFTNLSLGLAQGWDISKSISFSEGKYLGEGDPKAISTSGGSQDIDMGVFGLNIGKSEDYYVTGKVKNSYGSFDYPRIQGQNWQSISYGISIGTKIAPSGSIKQMYTTKPLFHIK